MQIPIKSIIGGGRLLALILATAACSPRPIPAMTVNDLMEDRVTLDGVLMKCNRDYSKARTDTECVNARIAIGRLAGQNEQAQEAKRAEEFEHARERLRLTQEKQRQAQEAKIPKVDAYHLPLVPDETTVAPHSAPPSAPRPSTTSDNGNPPLVRQ